MPDVAGSVEVVVVPPLALPVVPVVDEVGAVSAVWLLAVCRARSRLLRSSASFETPDAAEGGGGGGGGGGAEPLGGPAVGGFVPDGVVPSRVVPVDPFVLLDGVAAWRRAWRRAQVTDPPVSKPLDSMVMVRILS